MYIYVYIYIHNTYVYIFKIILYFRRKKNIQIVALKSHRNTQNTNLLLEATPKDRHVHENVFTTRASKKQRKFISQIKTYSNTFMLRATQPN